MPSPREIVCRHFKKTNGMFLNYDSQLPVELGDIGIWNGKAAEFEKIETLDNLGILPVIKPQFVPGEDQYKNADKAEFKSKGRSGLAAFDFTFGGKSRYALQAYDTLTESIEDTDLANKICTAIEGGLKWSGNWIVVTAVWKANSFTQLISSASDADAEICADIETEYPFNIADTEVGVRLGCNQSLSVARVAGAGARPYFIGKKYYPATEKRKQQMRKYGKGDGWL